MRKNIFLAVFLLSATGSFAQEQEEPVDFIVRHPILEAKVDPVYRKFKDVSFKTIVPKNAISFNAGYGIPFISNDLNSEQWNSKTGTGLNFGVDYKRQFMKTAIVDNEVVKTPSLLGMGIGLGISYFNQSAFMKNHTEELYNFTDISGDFCDVTFSYKGIKESVSLTYLDIPLYLEIGKPSQVKISGYFNVGVKASILISGKSTGEGTYTSSGHYENWNVNLNGNKGALEELNYYTDKEIPEKLESSLSSFVLWGSLAGGVNIPFSSLEEKRVSKFILRVGAKIDFTVLPVSKSMADPYFKGANYRINQSNILNSDGSRIFMPSIEIKLIYCIN